MGAPKDLHFGLEFANAPVRSHELLRLLGRHARDLASVDAVLFDPVVDGGGRDVEIVSGLGDRPP